VFNEVGLPLGGFMICLFLGWFWKTESALLEIESGFEGVSNHWFSKIWPIFIRWICPLLILLVLGTTLINFFR
ncbi:MAG: sodium-dependent transporter, partial [Balneolaceae bacterium]